MTAPHHRLVIAGLALGISIAAPPARADDLTPGQLRRLAARAAGDRDALLRLRRADTVAGRKVDLGGLLSGVRGGDLAARLEALADGAGADTVHTGPRRARAAARRILAGRAYRPEVFPRPFAGVLRRIGAWLAPLFQRVTAARDWVAARIPGGDPTVWALLAAVVVSAGVISAGRVARRPPAGRAPAAGRGAAGHTAEPDPSQLERLADQAARFGDHERAVRLRFSAGLMRLGRSGIIAYRPSITAGEVRRRLGSDAFESVSASFEEIVYGGRPATPGDAVAAERGWDEVLGQVKA